MQLRAPAVAGDYRWMDPWHSDNDLALFLFSLCPVSASHPATAPPLPCSTAAPLWPHHRPARRPAHDPDVAASITPDPQCDP